MSYTYRPGIDPPPAPVGGGYIEKRVIVSRTFMRDVINAAQVIWTMSGHLPTVEAVAANLYGGQVKNLQHVQKAMASNEFSIACAERGIPTATNSGITPAQVYAATIILNPADRRPMASKLRSAGVSSNQYRNWLRQPGFKAYVTRLSENLLSDHIGDVNAALTNKATGGDTQAMRMYYELNGMLGQQGSDNTDLNRVIMLLLEVITRQLAAHPDLLAAINNDITRVIKGEVINTDLPQLSGPVGMVPIVSDTRSERKDE